MAVLEVVQKIYAIGKTIHDIAETVQANRAQCKRLAERVQLVENALRGLSDYPDTQQFESTLNKLQNHLEQIAQFIQKFSQKNTLKQAYNYSTYQAKFVSLNTELVELIPLLNLGLTAHQVLNQTQDQEDQASDQVQWKKLSAQQAELAERQEEIRHQGEKMGEKIEGMYGFFDERMGALQAGLAEQMWAVLRQQPERKAAEDSGTEPANTIQPKDLTLSTLLCQGEGGATHQGEWLGQPVAIKTLSGHYPQSAQEALVREMKIFQGLRHPRVVNFYGWCADDQYAYLVMEYCMNRDLSNYLQQHANLTLKTKQQIALDIAKGLDYLHQKGLLHRDLNSHHVLLDQDLRAKLTDFRVSKDPSMQTLQSTHPSRSGLAWRAPETFQRKPSYTAASDVYSFGIVLWELMAQQTPFSGMADHAVIDKVKGGERLTLPAGCPAEYGALIEACWADNPEKRPAISKIVSALELAPTAALGAQALYDAGKNHERARQLPEALESYRSAANAGHAKALTAVGMFYLQGRAGLAQDKAMAHRYFQQGAEGGHDRAMYNLAEQLRCGDGVPKDESQALLWYERASRLNYLDSATQCERLRRRIGAQGSAGSKESSAALAMTP